MNPVDIAQIEHVGVLQAMNMRKDEQIRELVGALEQINNVAMGHPYAGVTCGEIARKALKIEATR